MRPVQPVSWSSSVRSRRGSSLLRPREADRRLAPASAFDAVSVGGRHVGERKIVAGPFRPRSVPLQRNDGGRRIELACRPAPAWRRPDRSPGRRAQHAGRPRHRQPRAVRNARRPPRGDASTRDPRIGRSRSRGADSARREPPGDRRSVRGAVPVPAQPADRELPRRSDGLRQAPARSHPPERGADLCRPDDAIRLHRGLHGVRRVAGSGQRRPVPGAADDARRAAVRDHGSGRRGRRRDRPASGAAASQRRRRRPGSAAGASARPDADLGSLGETSPPRRADRHLQL